MKKNLQNVTEFFFELRAQSTVEFVVLDLGQEPVCCYILV